MIEQFRRFMTGYWGFYLELEDRVQETRRFVEFDEINHKTYSSNYLMLFQNICSEIDVVGKEIAAHFNPDFEFEGGMKPINRWWYEIQDNLPDVNREISFAGAYSVHPWKNYRVARVVSHRNINDRAVDVINYNLQDTSFSTPTWWTAYNKVKHKRLMTDEEGVNYRKANLKNLSNAIAALYLLEYEYMKKVWTVEEMADCDASTLFGMGDLEDRVLDAVFAGDRQ